MTAGGLATPRGADIWSRTLAIRSAVVGFSARLFNLSLPVP